MSSAKRQFYFFISDLNVFYLFPCLIALVRTSNAVLNMSGQSGYLHVFPDIRGKTFSFSPESNASPMFVLFGLYYVEVHASIPNLLRVFIMNVCDTFLKS